MLRNKLIEYLSTIKMDYSKYYTRNDIISLLANDVYLVYLKCSDMDKYGRVLGDVYPLNNTEISASEYLLKEYPNYIKEYHGGHKLNFIL